MLPKWRVLEFGAALWALGGSGGGGPEFGSNRNLLLLGVPAARVRGLGRATRLGGFSHRRALRRGRAAGRRATRWRVRTGRGPWVHARGARGPGGLRPVAEYRFRGGEGLAKTWVGLPLVHADCVMCILESCWLHTISFRRHVVLESSV